ncbi:MAG: hypothetical protein OXE78_06245 [Gammaproteobacteria bacterium]|nr:hypothetical protein [Gammaproteobacteria bacterium]
MSTDWGDRELVWTLKVNGVKRKAYAILRQDYLVDHMVIASETGSLRARTKQPGIQRKPASSTNCSRRSDSTRQSRRSAQNFQLCLG